MTVLANNLLIAHYQGSFLGPFLTTLFLVNLCKFNQCKAKRLEKNQLKLTTIKSPPFKQKDFSLHCVALRMTMFLGIKAGLIVAAWLPLSTPP